jgi:hypothetical protein
LFVLVVMSALPRLAASDARHYSMLVSVATHERFCSDCADFPTPEVAILPSPSFDSDDFCTEVMVSSSSAEPES